MIIIQFALKDHGRFSLASSGIEMSCFWKQDEKEILAYVFAPIYPMCTNNNFRNILKQKKTNVA